jgi:hypothetical protein
MAPTTSNKQTKQLAPKTKSKKQKQTSTEKKLLAKMERDEAKGNRAFARMKKILARCN